MDNISINLVLKSLENRDKFQQRVIQDLKERIKKLEEELDFYKTKEKEGNEC